MSTRLFVAGLPYEVTDDQLLEYFTKVGSVASAKVIVDKYSGRSKGFGFVEMGSEAEAEKAINELNGSTFISRQIVVKEAYPKNEGQDFRPRGDNRSGRGGDNRHGDRRDYDRGQGR